MRVAALVDGIEVSSTSTDAMGGYELVLAVEGAGSVTVSDLDLRGRVVATSAFGQGRGALSLDVELPTGGIIIPVRNSVDARTVRIHRRLPGGARASAPATWVRSGSTCAFLDLVDGRYEVVQHDRMNRERFHAIVDVSDGELVRDVELVEISR